MNEIIDISPVLHPGIAVWPGDTPFSREVLMSIENSHIELSTIRSTVHLGAHADAPIHYHESGETMEKRSLEYYLGAVQIIEVDVPAGERILPQNLKSSIKAPRVLFKTNSFPDPDSFNEDFNSLSPELINFLADAGVVLVGLDTPSVDPFQSKKMESHLTIFQRNMAVLEGVILQHVSPGEYTLVALPLKIQQADASPVRAILINGDISSLNSSFFPSKIKT